MAFEKIIEEIASSAIELASELENPTNEVDMETSMTSETNAEIQETESEFSDNSAEGLANETASEFETERANLHLKIIGKDEYGRNVSDWCGCNNACTHTAL